MSTCIIYYSYSGITRRVAEKIQKVCGGDLIEVKSKEHYSRLTAYTRGSYRAMKEERDPIEPETIDVSVSDLVVIGTPVWAFKATPAINAAIAALKGCDGKKAIIFATCGGSAKDTLPILKKALEAKGMTITGEFVLNRKEIGEGQKINVLIDRIKAARKPLTWITMEPLTGLAGIHDRYTGPDRRRQPVIPGSDVFRKALQIIHPSLSSCRNERTGRS